MQSKLANHRAERSAIPAHRAILQNEAIDIAREIIRLRDEGSVTRSERGVTGSSPIATNFLAAAISARRSGLFDEQIRRYSERLSEPLDLCNR